MTIWLTRQFDSVNFDLLASIKTERYFISIYSEILGYPHRYPKAVPITQLKWNI